MIELKAYAKINLGLEVAGLREDGYHLVRLVMQTLDLYDTITIKKNTAQKNEIEMEILPGDEENAFNIAALPTDDGNLCIRAAKALLSDAGVNAGIRIELKKKIPFEAGLGGGSSDAACVLRGVNELLSLGYTNRRLEKIAVEIGADVPYLLYGGSMLCEGIGEKLSQIDSKLPEVYVVLVKPDFGAQTGGIYSAYDSLKEPFHPDIDGLAASMEKGDLKGLCALCGNALEEVTAGKHPMIYEIEDEMKKAGALAAKMTGSGPTVYGIFSDEDKANEAKSLLKESFNGCFVAKHQFVRGSFKL